jgi:DNA-binding NtrC family response regulator
MNFGNNDSPDGAAGTAYSQEKPPLQVLVVDDTKEVRELIALVLRPSGYRVLVAENGLAAKNILMTERPALVISDIDMPICDGWQVLEHCHSHHPAMPVLLISGNAFGRRPEIERWAAGSLRKPLNLDLFRAEIQRILRQAA